MKIIRPFLIAVTALMVLSAQGRSEPLNLDLASAVKIALERNPNIAEQQEAVAAARAQQRQAGAAGLPKLKLTSQLSQISKPTLFGSMAVVEKTTATHGATIEMPLYTGGRIRAMKEAAAHGVTAAVEQTEAARAEVAMGVIEAYLRALQAKGGIAVAEEAVASLEANLDAVRKLREAGMVVHSDEMRAEVALASARESRIQAENGYRTALAMLKQAMGVPQTQELVLSDASIQLPSSKESTGESEAKRPEIRALMEAVKAADAQVKAARSGSRPTIGLGADFQHISKGAFFPREQDTYGLAVQASWPIFDSGLTRAQVDQASAEKARIERKLQAMRDQVEMEVTRALLDVNTAEGKLAAKEKREQLASGSFRTLQVGYQEGINSQTDVLFAQAALVQAQVDRLNSLYDLEVSRARLLKARGELLPYFGR